MIALALAAQLGDLLTFVHMGVAYELNPVVHHMGIDVSIIAKLLLILVVLLFWIAATQRHPTVVRAYRMVALYSLVIGTLGMTSNLLVILA